MKFNELQALVLRKLDLQVKNLTPKIKNLTPKATYPTQIKISCTPCQV